MASSVELMSGNSVNPYANTDFAKGSQGDINNGRWGIDNWIRNLVSFGDYDRGRDAAYQLYLNNTSMQRAKADSLKAGINPLYTIGNIGHGAATTASTNLFDHKKPSKSGAEKAKGLLDSASKLIMVLAKLAA